MLTSILSVCFAAGSLWLCQPQESTPREAEPSDAAEYAALEEMRHLDANGDQVIDGQEFVSGQRMAAVILALSWEDCDADGDGVITPAELQPAAEAALQALLAAETDSEAEQEAEEALARAVPLSHLLDRLADDERYAEEIAVLREAVEDLDDDEAVVTYITKYPTRYTRLAPVIKTWVRHYPVRPGLRRLVTPHTARPAHLPGKAKPHKPPKPGPKAGKPGPKKPPKAGKKPGAKARPKSRPPRRP
jgi:hypothetical protein